MIKIPDTLQEVFNIVSTHLLTQIKRSKSCEIGKSGCAYRGKGGLKCAAGVLIPDDQYDLDFEGRYWAALVSDGIVENKFVAEISDLQLIHDTNGNDSLEYLKYHLIKFAEKNKLICNFEV
jgi:hypothetical protein